MARRLHIGAQETLESKLIQMLKELEAKVIGQISSLSPSDPRRIPLRDKLGGLRAQIDKENGAVADSISRTVRIARARVQALEIAVQKESQIAQDFHSGRVHSETADERP